jgi:hypothetical protein
MDDKTAEIVNKLNEGRRRIELVVAGLDPSLVVYQHSGWTLKDLLYHLAAWEEEKTKSLRAFMRQSVYLIPEATEDEFNARAHKEGQGWRYEDVLEHWQKIRQSYLEAIQEIPAENLQADILPPWGEPTVSVTAMILGSFEHESEHLHEILEARGA